MTCCFGWDVSSNYIGVALMDDGKLKQTWGIELAKCKSQYEKYDLMRARADGIIASIEVYSRSVCVHYVEDRLGNFTKGLTTLQTLMVLAQFNAVMSCHLNDRSPGRVRHMLPVTTKRIVGFKKVPDQDVKVTKSKLAAELCPSFVVQYTPGGNLQRGIGDIADAILLAIAGTKVEKGEAVIEPRKKAKRHKPSPRGTEAGQG